MVMLKKVLDTSINLLWSAIYAVVIIFLFVFGENGILSVFLTAVLITALCFFLKDRDDKKRIKIRCIVFFFFLLFLAFNIYFRAGWDVYVLTGGAWDEIFTEKIWAEQLIKAYDYLNMNPNNILLYGYYTIFAKLCFLFERGPNFYYAMMILVNIFIYTFTSFFLYENVKKLAGSIYADIAWYIYVILIGTSGWYIVPYSDSLTLFIPSLCLYLYLAADSRFKYLPISFLTALGFYIKPQAGIFMIAMVIINLIHDFKWEAVKKNALPMLLSVVCIMTVALPVEYIKHDYFEPDKALGFTHYIMMGLNEDSMGSYAIEDVDFSMQYKTAKERRAGNIQLVMKRLETNDMARHLTNKLLLNFNDGNFYFGKEGYFYSYVSKDFLPSSGFLKNVFLDTGKYYPVLEQIRQTLYVAVLFLSLFSLKDSRKEVLLIKLSLIGLFLFQMIFEARSRYLFIYIPFFIVLACIGIKEIKELIVKLKERQAA